MKIEKVRPKKRLKKASKRPKVLAGILSVKDKVVVRNRLLIVAVALALVGAIVAGVANYITTNRTPEEAVDSYLGAVERGSYFSAVDRAAFSRDNFVYIKSSAYRVAEHRVQEHRITKVTHSDADHAQAYLEVKVDGKWSSAVLPLKQTHKKGIFNDAWVLDQPAEVNQEVTAQFPVDELTVNGKTTGFGASKTTRNDDAGSAWDLVLLPGAYSIDTPQDSYYRIQDAPREVIIPLGAVEAPQVSLTFKPSPRMWSETNEKISEQLAKCASSRSLAPEGCPASTKYDDAGIPLSEKPADNQSAKSSPDASSKARIADVRWKLVDRPALVLEQSDEGPTSWASSRYEPAVFELTYTANGKAQRETIEFEIDAQVKSTGKNADITVSFNQ
ncbi:hypothetical protein HF984_07830 [Rothia terrae]|uniref:hypothetical protein n=1 Tax=Rothia terrae TaxID=396015 RepID=UPI001447BC06|nr:hypothetical protein [Rothia terrae]NKZ34664.1 hypothetical protein [Rothia terrae]